MKAAVVLGTRPEAIKLAPVVAEICKTTDMQVVVISTGQHQEMLDRTMQWFGMVPDVDLGLMQSNQSLSEFLGRCISTLVPALVSTAPQVVVVQGDTTSALAGALAAFHCRIPIAHVEAGLRTFDLDAPFPEEANRAMISRIATWNFAPTERAKQALLAENVPGQIFNTGNTIVDALSMTARRLSEPPTSASQSPLVLISGHRRENFGSGFESIFDAILELAKRRPGVRFVYPVHLNPRVRNHAEHRLGGQKNIRLVSPMPYPEFVALMRSATLILTDSGGIQEEAPTFGVPVLIMREKTERPEAVEAGVAVLVGTHPDRIVREAEAFLNNPALRATISAIANPFGDGHASERIVKHLRASSTPASDATETSRG